MNLPVYIIADTETTGFNARGGSTLTQIAALAVEAATGKPVSQGTVRVKLTPTEIQAFTKEAMDIQGWTPEINESGAPLETCRSIFQEWLKGFPGALGFVAHNATFDKGFFDHFKISPVSLPWFCTKVGIKALEAKGHPAFENHKLSTLAKAAGYTPQAAHQALDDVLSCATGFQWLLSKGVEPRDMLVAAAIRS